MTHKVKILKIEQLTHDVKRFTLEKPQGYKFNPGEYTKILINKTGFEDKKKPFSFTSINQDKDLEFTIKIYKERNSFTKALDELKIGDELIIDEASGSIKYKGKGIFIAGGAGITPFLSIFRELRKENKLSGNTLIFSTLS
jgi:ferredoxin-NADP reductase